jgi:hypothetical protein
MISTHADTVARLATFAVPASGPAVAASSLHAESMWNVRPASASRTSGTRAYGLKRHLSSLFVS